MALAVGTQLHLAMSMRFHFLGVMTQRWPVDTPRPVAMIAEET